MRILVCGGRAYNDWARVEKVLGDLCANAAERSEIACGGARGADYLAVRYAVFHGLEYKVYLPDWILYGRSAGPRRNEEMLTDFNPDLVVAFPGGKGTADMVARARKAGVGVLEVNP